jgi:hypothetical protein
MDMVKVKYIPERGTPDETETLNHKFSAKRTVEVTDEAVLAILRGNPFFEVLDKEQPPQRSVPPADATLVATEQPSGSYAVMMGESIVKDGLSKEEADAFNQLTDADKAEYVK